MAKNPDANNDGKVTVAEMLDDIRERLDALETRPTPETVNLSEIEGRLSAVEKAKNPDAPNDQLLASLANRVDALENRGTGTTIQPGDFTSLADRVAALEQRAPVEGAAIEVDAAHVNYVLQKYYAHERPAESGAFADNTTATPSETPAAQPVTLARPNPL